MILYVVVQTIGLLGYIVFSLDGMRRSAENTAAGR